MPSATISTPPAGVWAVPGGEVLVLVRRLTITALIAGVGYSMLSVASLAQCPGGIGADGGFTDRFGNPTEVVPSCITMTLRPSPAVFLVLAVIVVWAVARAVQNAQDEAAALRVLGRAGPTVIIIAVLSVVLTVASFVAIPLEEWDGASVPPIPGWLAVDVVITPMQSP